MSVQQQSVSMAAPVMTWSTISSAPVRQGLLECSVSSTMTTVIQMRVIMGEPVWIALVDMSVNVCQVLWDLDVRAISMSV